MAAKKAKSKPQPKKMSLRDRLAKHWEAGSWEAFVSLYLRDQAASESTPWVGRYIDGLYNLLTKSLFLDKSPETARETARLLLEGSGPGEPDEIARDCARVALDFVAMRHDPQAGPSPLSREDSLPEPWRALRAGLRQAADGPRKRGRKKKTEQPDSPAGALLQKLAGQFQALPQARNLRAYTTFLQTAEALENETAALPGAANFRALRIMATLLRELGGPKRGGDELRSLSRLESNKAVRSLPKGLDHPALRGLWNFFCQQGGKKFGREWEAAARVLRLNFDRNPPALAAAWTELFSRREGSPSSHRLMAVHQKYGAWSEPERYILGTAFCLALEKDGPRALDSLGGTVLLDNFKSLTVLGRKWRPACPWSGPARVFFEVLIRGLGNDLSKVAVFDLPYPCLTDMTLILMSALSPRLAETIAESADSRLPLKPSQDDVELLGFDFSRLNPIPDFAGLNRLKQIMTPDSLAGLLSAWVKSAVEAAAVNVVNHGDQPGSAWELFSPEILKFMAESIPSDDPAGIFIRLCLGRGLRSLPEAPEELAALTEALARSQKTSLEKEEEFLNFLNEDESEEPVGDFAANLFMMLTAWPQVNLDFMADLFRLGQGFLFDQSDLWSKAVTAVGLIKNAERRKALAQRLFAILKKAVDPERGEARRCFDNLQKGRKANPNLNKFRNPFEAMFRKMGGDVGRESAGDFDDFEAEMMNRFENLMGRRRKKKN